jgi:hypothetical protein
VWDRGVMRLGQEEESEEDGEGGATDEEVSAVSEDGFADALCGAPCLLQTQLGSRRKGLTYGCVFCEQPCDQRT